LIRELQVEEHQVRPVLDQVVQTCGAIFGHDDLEPFEGKGDGEHVPCGGIGVDDEDLGSIRC
jgi:hypothetical protein